MKRTGSQIVSAIVRFVRSFELDLRSMDVLTGLVIFCVGGFLE